MDTNYVNATHNFALRLTTSLYFYGRTRYAENNESTEWLGLEPRMKVLETLSLPISISLYNYQDDRIRTYDLSVPGGVLYQPELHPVMQ